jgi:hypothetical protein
MTDLDALLRNLSPQLDARAYRFACLAPDPSHEALTHVRRKVWMGGQTDSGKKGGMR